MNELKRLAANTEISVISNSRVEADRFMSGGFRASDLIVYMNVPRALDAKLVLTMDKQRQPGKTAFTLRPFDVESTRLT